MSDTFDFNKNLEELEIILQKMEAGDMSLEQTLKHFEKGIILTRKCQKTLHEAQQKITVLSADDDYQTSKPLDEE